MRIRITDRISIVLMAVVVTVAVLLFSYLSEAFETGGLAELAGKSTVQGGQIASELDFQVFRVDDGTAEIYTGSRSGSVIIANRYEADRPVVLRTIRFYTSGASKGMAAEVVVYEDPTGMSSGPDRMMEVWRRGVVLESGFQQVHPEGLVVNEDGRSDFAFYVGLAEADEGSFSLGIDRSGLWSVTSYLSEDGGDCFAPLSEWPVIKGNSMIRASEDPGLMGALDGTRRRAMPQQTIRRDIRAMTSARGAGPPPAEHVIDNTPLWPEEGDAIRNPDVLANDHIRASSGSDSCPACAPALNPGYPRFTLGPGIYEDYITIKNKTFGAIHMPIKAMLATLEPTMVVAYNPDGGGDRPPTTFWEFSLSNNDGTDSMDEVLDPGERITRIWQFQNDGGYPFSFWANAFALKILSSDPSGISNLQLWYDYKQTLNDGGLVCEWTDLSGNGNHMVQTTDLYKPIYTAGEGLYFDGDDDHGLISPDPDLFGTAQDFTVFIVMKKIEYKPDPRLMGYGQDLPYPQKWLDFDVTGQDDVSTSLGLVMAAGWAGSYWIILADTRIAGIATDDHRIYCHIYNKEDDHHSSSLYVDGFLEYTETRVSSDYWEQPTNPNQDAIVIGSASHAPTDSIHNFNGYIKQIIMYNKALTDSERAHVEAYLNRIECWDADGDGYEDDACGGADCDDSAPSVYPGATELCDGADNNCAGDVDEEPAASASCDNELYCDGDEYCSEGACQAGDAPCVDDGQFCNGIEYCDEDLDQCLSSGDPCIDGSDCTDDLCDEEQDECDNRCIATWPGDPCCEDLACADDPNCSIEFTLDLEAFYLSGYLVLNYTIGTPVPATWATYLIFTDPTIQIYPLWDLPIWIIIPPIGIPFGFPFPQVGWVGIYTGLFSAGEPHAEELAWVDTGWPSQ